jgi:hypothetical protein
MINEGSTKRDPVSLATYHVHDQTNSTTRSISQLVSASAEFIYSELHTDC